MNLLKTFTSHPWREGKVLALSPQKQQGCSCKWHSLFSQPQKWWHSFLHSHKTPQGLRTVGFWLPLPSPSNRDVPGEHRLPGSAVSRYTSLVWMGIRLRRLTLGTFSENSLRLHQVYVQVALDHQGVSTQPHMIPGQRNCRLTTANYPNFPKLARVGFARVCRSFNETSS